MNNQVSVLYGLVLAGGKSTRMGKDKAVIAYHQKPQFQHVFDLLDQVCERVFISSRFDQNEFLNYGHFPTITDHPQFQGKGPISGILSAMIAYPQVSWLILACDLPFVTGETLTYLIQNRDRNSFGTAYKSQFDGLPEPLCAIWEDGHLELITNLFEKGVHCPRKILIQSGVRLIDIQTLGELDNINNPAEAASVGIRLQKNG